ncbi:retinal-binding protein [Nephila pilipes]|uniref:Retinal-binding protein n=1 Tax=Nephila pilipes TaxID=299642 RepID=A0A8X6N760_NEPPI|nr:retinal-binding protein [Nephila pilipes]
MSVGEEFSISEKNKEIEQLRARLPSDVDKDMYNDTYQLYLILKEYNFDVNEGEIALKKILNWKTKLQLEKYDEANISELIKKYFEKHLLGFSKENGVVHYFPFGKLDSKGVCMSIKFSDLEKLFGKIFEDDLQMQRTKKEADGSYPRTICIFDMEGLTFANATDKKGIDYIIRILKSYQDYYPGILKTIYVINISTYFLIPCSIVKSCLSSSFVSRVQFYGTDDWQEELLKVIDADHLPAFLGGNKTDPDGNPLCKTLVMQAGKIDEKHYIQKSKTPIVNSPGVKKIVLARASFSEIELEIKEDGSLIEWEFETKTRDIGFGLFYKDKTEEEKIIELVPLLRIDTEDYSETGVYKCEKAGTYIMLFDNSYSWIRSKEIYYRTKITLKKEHEAALQD